MTDTLARLFATIEASFHFGYGRLANVLLHLVDELQEPWGVLCHGVLLRAWRWRLARLMGGDLDYLYEDGWATFRLTVPAVENVSVPSLEA